MMFSEDEWVVFIISGIIVFFGFLGQLLTGKPRLYLRNTSASGLVRLSVLLSMGWVVYVLYNHADPSVVGAYRMFYILLGLAVIFIFGLGGAGRTGMRNGVDVMERNNPAAGVLIAAFVLATGMIYGGSLWGEADPDGDGEGGWWIPMGFFISGWISLCIATVLFRRRETSSITRRIRQMRNPREALGFALYLLSSGWILCEAVAGDFYGWKQGLTTVGAIGGMLVTHEVIGMIFSRNEAVKPRAMTGIEVISYIAWGVGFSVVNRYVLPSWGIQL
ncbi:MAG TPA: hypothetical protein PJ991_06545 [Kiritimatiellia bacterium]|nr:hypothetical protein [Kiritimatiellia bacterium]